VTASVAQRSADLHRVTLLAVDPLLVAVAGAVGVLGLAWGRAATELAPRLVRDPHGSGGTTTRTLTLAPVVAQVGTGVLVAAVVLRVGLVPALPAWLWFAAGAALLTVVDLRYAVLPNRLLGPLVLGALGLLTAASVATGTWSGLVRALLASVVVAGVLLGLALVQPASLGAGDVKLGLLLGLYLGWLGWPSVLVGMLVAAVVQALAGSCLLVLRRAGRDTQLPFGPALLGGVVAVLFLAAG